MRSAIKSGLNTQTEQHPRLAATVRMRTHLSCTSSRHSFLMLVLKWCRHHRARFSVPGYNHKKERPPPIAEAVPIHTGRCDLLHIAARVDGDAAGTLVFLRFIFLAGTHCLLAPLFSRCNIRLHSICIAVVNVRLAPIREVDVGHSVVVVGPVCHSLVQVLQAFRHQISVLTLDGLHYLLGSLHAVSYT